MKWSPFFESLPVPSRTNGLIPAIDVYDQDDRVVIETALPGVEKKNVKLTVENNMLTISGSSERKTEVDEKNYYHKEIRSGSFLRQVSLPVGTVADQAKAEFKDGMLTITFPKKELPKSQSITIDVNNN